MSVCSTVRIWIKKLSSKIDTVLIRNVEGCIKVTEYIKSVLDSPGMITVVELTPVKWDDVSRKAITEALAFALKSLHVIKDIKDLSNNTVTDFRDQLKGLSEDERNAILFKVASLMAAKVDGFKEKQNLYDAATQLTYTMSKK